MNNEQSPNVSNCLLALTVAANEGTKGDENSPENFADFIAKNEFIKFIAPTFG